LRASTASLAGLWPFSRLAGVESNVIERWIRR
jgi:hypothetical protein